MCCSASPRTRSRATSRRSRRRSRSRWAARSRSSCRRARDLFGAYVLLATFAIVMLEGAAETASGKHGYLAIALGALARGACRRSTSCSRSPTSARDAALAAAGIAPLLVTTRHARRDPRAPGGARRAADQDHSGDAGGRGRRSAPRSSTRSRASCEPTRAATRYEAAFNASTIAAPAHRARREAGAAADDGQRAAVRHACPAEARARRRPGALRPQPTAAARHSGEPRSPRVLAGDAVGLSSNARDITALTGLPRERTPASSTTSTSLA